MIPFIPFFLAAVVIHLAVYFVQCLRSPLRKIPGPAHASFTSLVLKWHELHANRTQYVHGLHKKYGPSVRLSPDEVSFASYEAVKEIYCSSGSGYDKTGFYDLFKVYNRRTMFTTLNKEDHAKRKRILADRYANSNIMKSASLSGIEERSQKFLDRLQESVDKRESHDIFMTLHAYACDCATNHLFNPYGTDCLQKKADEDMMHEVAADDSLKSRLIQHYYPNLYNTLSGVLDLFIKPRSVPLATNYVMSISGKNDPSTFTLLSRMQEKSAAGMQLDQTDMAGECLDHMAAGIDTTGDGLCFLMWELSQPASLKYQLKLQEELRANPGTSFDKLPFLDAVVQESLRCFPPIPMSLPRYVPQGGRTISGYFVPEKTIVSCQAFSVHRINEHVFPEPDIFDPDRWLAAEGDAERKRIMFAFANGGRGCVGKHLALAEMKTLLKDVYAKYTTLPDPSMTPAMMAMADQAISSRPVSKTCLLHFVPGDAAAAMAKK
ncbi:cytochrome P450 [Plectosphaerella plurivora]|uniref:Cytochrome P450 n=1 Tax=Plectosphaerella plurivora TaxID=936078 RepID=A0A9P9AFU2_9PEZI|nr:cytochrome P450 [Plectosphaerella plurivora]